MVRQANEQEDNCFDLPWLQLHIGCAVTQVKLIVFLLNMVLQYEPERIIERKCSIKTIEQKVVNNNNHWGSKLELNKWDAERVGP